MSIDWQSLYSHLDNVRSSDERNGPGMLRLAVDRIIEVMSSLYRSYDDLVRHMQSSITTMSRECANLSVMLRSLESQLGSMLRATTLPGGRGLYVLQDISTLNRAVYDDLYGGYICRPVCEIYPLRKDPRSHPDLVIGYSTGKASIEGDIRSLFEASDRAVSISVVSPGVVSAATYDLNIPPNYRSGAVVRLDLHTTIEIPYNEIILESEHPISVLDYGFVSGNYLNRINNFPDPNATGAWINAAGSTALFEYEDIRGSNALTLVPDTPNAFVRFNPANRIYPIGYLSPGTDISRITFMVFVSYRVVDEPVEATFNIIDDTGRRYISHSQVLYPRREQDLILFSGALPKTGRVGCTISVRRVGDRAGRLRILSINLFEWLNHCQLSLPPGTRFVFPAIYRRNSCTFSVTLALHASEPSEEGQRYYCTLKRFEPRVIVYGKEAELVAPPVTQKTHPITEAVVFVEGENLENSDIIVAADPSFTRTVTVPASEAVNGARVEFVPVFGNRFPQMSGYQIPVPLQLASEQFTHGREFDLKNVPYCSAVMVRQMLDKFGKYEPNLDLAEVDFEVLMGAGTTVTGLVEVIETNPSDWKGSVLGVERIPQTENGYMILEGNLPAYGGSITESVDKVVTMMSNVRGIPTIIKDRSGNYLTQWSGWGTYWRVQDGSAVLAGTRASATLDGLTVTNPFDEPALIIHSRIASTKVWSPESFPIRKGWYRLVMKAQRPAGLRPINAVGIILLLHLRNSTGLIIDTISPGSVSFPSSGDVNLYFEVPRADAVTASLVIVVDPIAKYVIVTMPVLYPEYPPVSQQTASNIQSLGWNINASPCFTDDVEVKVGLTGPLMLSGGHRIRFKRLSVQNAISSGSQPGVELVLYKEGGGSVSCGQPLPGEFSGNANSGTWTDITWEAPSGLGNDVRVIDMVIRIRRLNPSTASFQLNIDRLWENNKALVEVIRQRSISDPDPDEVQVALEWRGRSPIIVPEGEALTLSMQLQGFGQSLTFQMNGRVWGDDRVIIRDPEYTGENSESIVRTLTVLLIGDGSPVEMLKIVAHGSLSSTEKRFLLGARTSMRKLSVFSTLVPIKLTVETPFGVFTPDVSGPLPAVGTRDVENERLALASDQQLEQYEQAVMEGQVSRQIKYDRPVYSTRFSPIAIHPNGYPILTLDLYRRSNGSKVRILSRNEYLLDAHRGLIQLIDDPGADYYLVATYRFKVTGEAQLRMYESLVRGVMLTRNRTDYLSGLIPALQPVQFRADEVSGRPILEYYHQGNKLVLAQDIPPSVDGRYTIRADYWYLPISPTVKVVLRRPDEVRTPVVRRIVLMV